MSSYDVSIGPYQWKGLTTDEYGVSIGPYQGNALPVITDQSVSSGQLHGVLVTLFVTATGVPAPTYQWYLDGPPISGATSNTYQFYASVDQTYTCRVTNVVGYVDSDPITITVVSNPYVTNLFNIVSDLGREG